MPATLTNLTVSSITRNSAHLTVTLNQDDSYYLESMKENEWGSTTYYTIPNWVSYLTYCTSPVRTEGTSVTISNLESGGTYSGSFTTTVTGKYTKYSFIDYDTKEVEVDYWSIILYDANGNELSESKYYDEDEFNAAYNELEDPENPDHYYGTGGGTETDTVTDYDSPLYDEGVPVIVTLATISKGGAIFYTAPGLQSDGKSLGGNNNFTFKTTGSPSSGEKWRVDQGLQSLLDNIYTFGTFASLWKTWKNQSKSECPGFPKGLLSASTLNSIGTSLGMSGYSYSPKTVIAASMFTQLESQVNNLSGHRTVVIP